MNLDNIVKELNGTKDWAVDVETPQSLKRLAKIIGMGIGATANDLHYIPITGDNSGVPWTKFRQTFQPFFKDPNRIMLNWNNKFDIKRLVEHGIEFKNKILDVQVAKHLLEEYANSLKLKDVVFEEFGVKLKTYNDVKDGNLFDKKEFDTYACNDVKYPRMLWAKYEPMLKKQGLLKLFYDIEMRVLPVWIEMEMTGVKWDIDYLTKLDKKLTTDLAKVEKECKKIVGNDEFSLRSSQQVSKYLFNGGRLKTNGVPKGKSGFYSTDINVLKDFKGDHPLVDKLLEYRGIDKLHNTYVVSLLDKAKQDDDNRVYATYNVNGTPISRASCVNPNFQNIPRKGEGIRKAVIAEEGNMLVCLDFNQLELRMMAHYSKDKEMLRAFNADEDIHGKVQKGLKISRTRAKGINFGMQYMGSPWVIQQELECEWDEAEGYYKKWHKLFPSVKIFQAKVLQRLLSKGFVINLFGRRRRFHNDLAKANKIINLRARKGAENRCQRQAVQFLISSSSTDIMKIGMRNSYEEIQRLREKQKEWRNCRFILQVHDEIVMECPVGMNKKVTVLLKDKFENAAKISVPLPVNISSGNNWVEAKG